MMRDGEFYVELRRLLPRGRWDVQQDDYAGRLRIRCGDHVVIVDMGDVMSNPVDMANRVARKLGAVPA